MILSSLCADKGVSPPWTQTTPCLNFNRLLNRLGFFFFLGFFVSLTDCSSSSVLIRTKDRYFASSQKQLEKTTQTINSLHPPAAEQTLFLQAEGFYRYRFEPLSQSSAMYFAQAAAAITDFPAFQSLAGSLNLQDIRYRSSDSAVQLWESLLSLYPKSSLKPMTLYRLGWAYRNVGTRGLPRNSPNEAFEELIRKYPLSPLASLAKEAKAVPWKSKDIATTWSLLPGAGQIYLGQTKSGVVRMSIATTALMALLLPIREAARSNGDLNWQKDKPLLLIGLAGLIALSFDYTNSYEDAMKGVVEWNERKEDQFNRRHPNAF